MILDNIEQARAVAAASAASSAPIPALIEIDSDGHRAGVRPDDPLLIEIGTALHRGGAELRGVMTHAGASYDCRSEEELIGMAERERASVVYAAESLRAAGLPAPVVSVGSSPTAHFARDLVRRDRGSCRRVRILRSRDGGDRRVPDRRYRDERVVELSSGTRPTNARSSSMRAGWRCRATWAPSNQSVDQGYGLVCDVNGVPYDGSHREEHESGARAAGDSATAARRRCPICRSVRSCASCRITHARQRPSTRSTSCWTETESRAAGPASPQAGSRARKHEQHDLPALSALPRRCAR